ncbi:MAG TPA: GNAT family N-acetyltransferase [Roseiflexaceae bacterium]|nr:GNAT family N-acetyltransferase [Roseiflexaceae bacterium]
MEIRRFDAPQSFLAHASHFLLEREAEHNLILGLAAELEHNLFVFGSQPYMATVEDHGRIVAAALMTPPHNLILSRMADDAAIPAIVADLARFAAAPAGVIADVDHAAAFAELWCAPRGLRYRRNVAERIFQLTAVRPPRPVPGSMREATNHDRPLLVEWFTGFNADALSTNIDHHAAERAADRWLSSPSRTLYLWEDGEVVSMTGVAGPTPHGIRVSAVYTPPAQRRRGYASALVAAASQRQLDMGRSFCFLYTDLSNPTSNHIYQEIGYEPVVDVDEMRFGE